MDLNLLSLVVSAVDAIGNIWSSSNTQKQNTAREIAIAAQDLERMLHQARNLFTNHTLAEERITNEFESSDEKHLLDEQFARHAMLQKAIDVWNDLANMNSTAKVDLELDLAPYLARYNRYIAEISAAIMQLHPDELNNHYSLAERRSGKLPKIHSIVYGSNTDEIGRGISSITRELDKNLKKYYR